MTGRKTGGGRKKATFQPYKELGLNPPRLTPIWGETVRCLVCGGSIRLLTDSVKHRQAHIDPRQLMRDHIAKHFTEEMDVVAGTGWLFEMLFFRCPDNPARWKRSIVRTLDRYLSVKGRITRRRLA